MRIRKNRDKMSGGEIGHGRSLVFTEFAFEFDGSSIRFNLLLATMRFCGFAIPSQLDVFTINDK